MIIGVQESIQKTGAIVLWSPDLEKETELSLSEPQRRMLLQCVADDLTAQKADQRYFPTQQLLGLIHIQDSERNMGYGGSGGMRIALR